jgi:methyl-accepting chemotaxis protein
MIRNISETIVAMDETTQQNAALVEEAQRLARAVSVFKLQNTGPDAQSQTPRGPQLARSNQALAAA